MEEIQALIESMISLVAADGKVSNDEAELLTDLLTEIWEDSYGNRIEEVKTAKNAYVEYMKGGGSAAVRIELNAKKLSGLKNKQKKVILKMMEALIKADGRIDKSETLLYVKFKEGIKADSGVLGFLKKSIVSVFSQNCLACESTRTVVKDIEEKDRWKGQKNVTEKLASGKTKTRSVTVTFVQNAYKYLCEECGHDFVILKKEEK